MSTTLSYGYIKPAVGDKGSTFFTQLQNDIQQLNDHAHNGVDSALLTSAAITPAVSVNQAAAASWGADLGGGRYRQLLTVPGSVTYDHCWIVARNTSSKAQAYPTIEKVSTTTFYVYSNDNTIGYDMFYLS